MKLYEVEVELDEREKQTWEIEALSEQDARMIATNHGAVVIVSVKDTLFRSAR